MAKAIKAPPQHNPFRPNIWGMLTQIFVHLIDTGQLLVGMVGTLLIIAFLKMTNQQLETITHEALMLLKEYHILGWIASALLTPTFIVMYSRAKKLHKKEIERLTGKH